jgi:hypothetical protein
MLPPCSPGSNRIALYVAATESRGRKTILSLQRRRKVSSVILWDNPLSITSNVCQKFRGADKDVHQHFSKILSGLIFQQRHPLTKYGSRPSRPLSFRPPGRDNAVAGATRAAFPRSRV